MNGKGAPGLRAVGSASSGRPTGALRLLLGPHAIVSLQSITRGTHGDLRRRKLSPPAKEATYERTT
jgi:hypothetical protein